MAFLFYTENLYTAWKKTEWANLQKVNLRHNTRRKYFINVGLLKHIFRITACWSLKKMLKVSTSKIITQQVARLYADYLTGLKIPGIVWII